RRPRLGPAQQRESHLGADPARTVAPDVRGPACRGTARARACARRVTAPQPPYVCPVDGGPLAAGASELSCVHGHAYPVDGGIPRFAVAAYSSAFGAQWLRFR